MELCCFGTQALGWIECHPGFAGWLQAVGAIISLWLAIGIPYVSRHFRAVEAREAAFVTAVKTLDYLDQLVGWVKPNREFTGNARRIRARSMEPLLDMLANAPTAEMRNLTSATTFGSFRIAAHLAFAVIQEASDAGLTQRECDEIKNARNTAAIMLDELQKELGLAKRPEVRRF